MDTLRALREKTIVRYIVVGGTSYVLELSALLAMYHVLELSLELSTTIAYCMGLLLAFSLQKFIAFRDKRRQVKVLAWQGILFALLTVWNLLFTILVVRIFGDDQVALSRTIAQAIFVCWNYVLYKNIIFKDRNA